jgi:hypothetical protein
VKEEAIALMDNCIKRLLKAVNVSCVLQLLKAAKEEEAVALQVFQEEAWELKRFEKLVQKCEVQN